ncbi:LOW QUALITY PROTEIN: hypothetical protein TorRG33x02_170580 [Trema orientale]|uniref:Uncharacterized protein n=1 Tax=Trema orientale TaxID=63057 RepID=A0A2P5ENM4_TREOI|nr:LOW QUALITY PROTEIN: hypothetical protein TorRG33x02_170580 [Trema orientale]
MGIFIFFSNILFVDRGMVDSEASLLFVCFSLIYFCNYIPQFCLLILMCYTLYAFFLSAWISGVFCGEMLQILTQVDQIKAHYKIL